MNQSSDNIQFSYSNWRKGFLRVTLIGASIFGLVAVIPAVTDVNSQVYISIYVSFYLILLTLTVLPVSSSIKAGVLTGLIFLLGISGLTESGIRGDAPMFMLGAITMAALLFSWRVGWIVTGLAMLSFITAGWLVTSGIISITSTEVTAGGVGVWATGSTSVLLLAIVIVNGIRLTQIEFSKAQDRAQSVLDVIRNERSNLEQKVEQRTQDLADFSRANERRAQMFQAVTQVIRAVISTQNLQDLLPQITRVISQQFGFYHTGIFLLDTNKEYAILSAANSEGGQKMLDRNHKLRVGEVGIVGYVAGTAKPRIALDTGADAIYFNNPDLPGTKSEMALPLIQLGGEIIGILDIQSTESNAFTNEDIEILSTLADQITVAIANALLYDKTQKTLLEAEMLYRSDLQTKWKQFTFAENITGIHRAGMKSNLYTESMKLPGEAEVMRSGTAYIKNDVNSQMTLPVKLRGEIIGMLNIKTNQNHAWTDDEMDIINAIVERAAVALENARLLTESRNATERERVIGEISSRISASTEIDSILKTAVRELGKQIGGAQITVEMESTGE